MKVLVCNAGSTSLKFKLFQMPSEEPFVSALVERVGSCGDAIFRFENQVTKTVLRQDRQTINDYQNGISRFIETLFHSGLVKNLDEIQVIGYKTVLAKGFYGVHELTDEVLEGMRAWLDLAPVHNRAYLESIAAMKRVFPHTLMVGSFETAFHITVPLERKLYGVPYEWYESYGIQRLGFHGASHSYIASVLDKERPNYRAISCHLGGSGSLCAIENGHSVDTSFGMSLETGLIHAKRVGNMDPTIVYHMESEGLSKEEIQSTLTSKGGLLGISGVSGDLRYVAEAAEAGNRRAQLALDVFITGIVRYIGAFYLELGGLDYLVFTAGIGEHSALVRGKVCKALEILGVNIDGERNRRNETVISTPKSTIEVRVIPTDEELVVARKVYRYHQETI